MRVRFKDIEEGTIFKYNSYRFIKIENVDTIEYGHINAVCLDNGQTNEFEPNTEIEI